MVLVVVWSIPKSSPGLKEIASVPVQVSDEPDTVGRTVHQPVKLYLSLVGILEDNLMLVVVTEPDWVAGMFCIVESVLLALYSTT